MRVTLFIPNLVGNGAERVVVNLANYLSDAGHDVGVLNYRPSECPFALREKVKRYYLYNQPDRMTIMKKVFLRFFSKTYQRFVLKNRRYRLNHFIKRNPTDCYLVMLESATIDLLNARKSINCPIIVSERNFPENYPPVIREQLYALSNGADAYVFQTEAAKACYGDRIRKSIVIPNAVNEGFIQLAQSNQIRKKKIITAGRLERQKNHDLLIRAFQKADLSGFTLEIYGEGPLREQLQELINTLGLSGSAFLKGYTDQIKDRMLEASLFVLSSDFEGIPNVLLEAMATGTPCITTDFAGGGAHALIDDGKNGLIVPTGDEAALADAMRRILSDQTLYHSIAEKAKEKTMQFYPEIIYAKWERFIEEVVTDHV